MQVGRLLGARFGRMAEMAAGLGLCGLGALILVEHLAA
jgi:putative Mn2+ efflux pump MntP